MVIVAVDIETQGLDATRYIIGCLIRNDRTKPEFYTNKNDLWNRLLSIARAEQTRGKTLTVYAHNHQYDFYGYADLNHKGIKIYSERPFIVSLYENDKEIIKFLDTLSLYRMPLKEVGKLVGLEKLETPKQLLTDDTTPITPTFIQEIKPYLQQDTEIVLRAYDHLRKELAKHHIQPKKLYTINQIAITALLNHIRNNEPHEHFFWNAHENETRRTFRATDIHHAYRGGRNEAFKTGTYNGVTHIDINSLYPYAASTMRFPDLRTERKTYNPNKQELIGLLQKIGLTKCLLHNKNNDLGLLPVRTDTGNYYPKKGSYLLGVWTHDELTKALTEGYDLIQAEWSITYDDNHNVLKNYMTTMYEQKETAGDPFQRYLYKSLMNCALGKLGQTRNGQDIIIDSVEKASDYLKKNYDIIKGHNLNYLYKNQENNETKKSYYTPIIPTLVNARARILLYEALKKIPLADLLYTDTDSIMFLGQHLHNFNISKEMGDWKIVKHTQNGQEQETCDITIYGRKTYMLGDDAHISGYRKKDITRQEFSNGDLIDKKMVTILSTNNLSEVGTFRTETRNLKIQQENHEMTQELYKQTLIFVDNDTTDITKFSDNIISITSTVDFKY